MIMLLLVANVFTLACIFVLLYKLKTHRPICLVCKGLGTCHPDLTDPNWTEKCPECCGTCRMLYPPE